MKNTNIVKSAVIILTIFLLANTAACQTKSKAQKSQQTKEVICSVTIKFGSPGTGIDHKTMDELKTMLVAKKVKYTETLKGREGERDWCLTLTELKGADKTTFVEALKKTAESGKFVSFSRN